MKNHEYVDVDKKEIIDITLPFYPEMEKPSPTFKGFQFQWDLRIETGGQCNRSAFSMETHVGTHVDAPLHFIENGKSIDQMPINQLIGKAQIIEVPFPEVVSSKLLITRLLNEVKIVIFKFGRERLDRKHPYFSPDGVNYLIKKGIKTVGTDNYNVDSETTQYKIHHLILGQEMMIIEGLKLDEVSPGFYELICLPILIRGGEAAPARAILIR